MPTYDLQRNFRFSAHYLDLLAQLSEQLGLSQAEILRRLLDQVDSRRGEILKIGQRLIGQIEAKYGREARLEFRQVDGAINHDVYVDDKADDGLIGIHGKGDDHRWRLYLATTPSSDYEQGLFRSRPLFYVGPIDIDSPASISISVGDLHTGLLELHGLLGR